MQDAELNWTMRDRVTAILQRKKPDRLPFIDRMEIWREWENGPMIWGGIPSPILEERTRDREFKEYVHGLLTTIGNQAMIIGVGDMVLGNNLIERVRYIAEQVEQHTLKAE
jgi:hypothetical protein